MVNLCKIVVVTAPVGLQILKRIPYKFPALPFAFTNPFLLENVIGRDILQYMVKVIHFIRINKKDIPTRHMEYTLGMDMPYHPVNGQVMNLSLHPLEVYVGPFFIMHKLSDEESEKTAIATTTLFLDTQYKEIFVYEPEFTQVVDICKFA